MNTQNIRSNFFLPSFRHWKGIRVAFETNGNQLEVKRLLRHKSVDSTMKFIGQIDFKTDDFNITIATKLEDALRLGGSGWIAYSVANINCEKTNFFKKPKRFMSNV